MGFQKFVALMCAFVIGLCAFNATAAQPEVNTAAQLAAAKRSVIALQETAERGVITRSQADEGSKPYLDEASKLVGHPVTLPELMAAPDAEAAAAPTPNLTWAQRAVGAITWVSILWVLAIGIGVVSISVLFGRAIINLLSLLKHVPLSFYEFVFYASSIGLGIWGRTLQPGVREYLGLTACLLFAAALIFTSRMRKLASNMVSYSGTLFVVWTIAAIVYGSSMLGFLSVAALLSLLGFSVLVTPLCYAFGFKDDAAVLRGTGAALVILAAFVGMRLTHKFIPAFATFEGGALFLGSFVGYLGLLIASSRWYSKGGTYVLFQVLTIVFGVAALFVGSVFGISELQKIGGTFFVLYMIEKPFEIPAKSAVGYAFVGLAGSSILFATCWFIKSHADLFAQYVYSFQ